MESGHTQQIGGLTGIVGRVPAHMILKSQPFVNSQAARCNSSSSRYTASPLMEWSWQSTWKSNACATVRQGIIPAQLQRRCSRTGSHGVHQVTCRYSTTSPVAREGSNEEHLRRNSITDLQGPMLPPPEFLPRKVAVFWDLDNKPPKNIPPYNAAMHLKNLASGFGELVDVVAYANRHAFTFVPQWVREERRDRKLLDQLEVKGLVQVQAPYMCSLCGRKCQNNLLLKKHFKQLHERERNKRLKHMDHLKGKRRMKFREKYADKDVRYKEASRGIITPKLGYGLASELKRAGIFVRTVQDQPQAADIALKRHMLQSFKQGVKCICLVSDDSDFGDILKMARYQKLRTVVVGDTRTLKNSSDMWFSWDDVASGKARFKANEDYDRWVDEDALAKELLDDEDDVEKLAVETRLKDIFDDDDFNYSARRVTKVSVFSDEEVHDFDGDSDDSVWNAESDSDGEYYYSSEEEE